MIAPFFPRKQVFEKLKTLGLTIELQYENAFLIRFIVPWSYLNHKNQYMVKNKKRIKMSPLPELFKQSLIT